MNGFQQCQARVRIGLKWAGTERDLELSRLAYSPNFDCLESNFKCSALSVRDPTSIICLKRSLSNFKHSLFNFERSAHTENPQKF
jgi:hypothetical protein